MNRVLEAAIQIYYIVFTHTIYALLKTKFDAGFRSETLKTYENTDRK
jgi:hypothetical protein